MWGIVKNTGSISLDVISFSNHIYTLTGILGVEELSQAVIICHWRWWDILKSLQIAPLGILACLGYLLTGRTKCDIRLLVYTLNQTLFCHFISI